MRQIENIENIAFAKIFSA